MRLLHTSDWHLGRPLMTASLVEHQAQFLDWLAELCRAREVDAVLVSGDVYDRAVPSVEAIGLFEAALTALVRVCPVVMIAGNHDSATRLSVAGRLLEAVDVHFRTSADDIARPVELRGVDGTAVLVYGIPYLEPERARGPLQCEKSHASVLTAAMDLVRDDLEARRSAALAAGAQAPRAIAMSHAFITGGQASDSERDVSVGGIADAPATLFAGVDYVALGHLHGPQTITADATLVRYSGSPIAYSFSEEHHVKSVTIVDLDGSGAVSIEVIDAPVPRSMRTIIGDLDHLLADPALDDAVGCWIRAIVTDARRPDNAMDRLRARFPHTIDLRWQAHLEGQPLADVDRRVDPATVSPIEVVAAFIEHVTNVPANDVQLQLADQSVQRVRLAEVEA